MVMMSVSSTLPHDKWQCGNGLGGSLGGTLFYGKVLNPEFIQ